MAIHGLGEGDVAVGVKTAHQLLGFRRQEGGNRLFAAEGISSGEALVQLPFAAVGDRRDRARQGQTPLGSTAGIVVVVTA